jgi:hypothetical protein
MLKTGDYPYWQEPEYNAALAFEPDIVIIMLGTNDSKPWNWTPANSLLFEQDYKDFINSFRNLASNPKIIISYPCKAYNSNFGISDSVIVNAICPIINQISVDMGTTLVDMHTETSGISNLFPDGIHPNAEGATRIANKFYSIIGTLTGIMRNTESNTTIYPNPVSDDMVVRSIDFQHNKIDVFDVTGNLLISRTTSGEPVLHIPVHLPEGMYFIKISNENHSLFKKIVVANK